MSKVVKKYSSDVNNQSLEQIYMDTLMEVQNGSMQRARIHTMMGQTTASYFEKLILVPFIKGGLHLAVPFIPFTPNRQNRNQVCLNICAGVLRLLRLPRLCRKNSHVTCSKKRWWSTANKVLRFCPSR